jgi:hypothetical protein
MLKKYFMFILLLAMLFGGYSGFVFLINQPSDIAFCLAAVLSISAPPLFVYLLSFIFLREPPK